MAQRYQVAAQLAHRDRVGFAVERDVIHDLLAAVDAVLNVGVEVTVDIFVFWEVVQGDLGKRQVAGDILPGINRPLYSQCGNKQKQIYLFTHFNGLARTNCYRINNHTFH